MKIAFICAVFPPEPAPSGVMAEQLAERLVADGHEVTMIVPFPNRPAGAIYPGYRRQVTATTQAKGGYTLVRCGNWLIGKQRKALDRLLENISFGLTSTWALWRAGRPDVLLIESWPIFAVLLNVLLARLWRVPYFLYVKDIYPEAAIDAGLLRENGWGAKLCYRIDSYLCTHSQKVIVIADTMVGIMCRKRDLLPEKIEILQDWIREDDYPACARNPLWRAQQGIDSEQFVALFAGTLGYASGVEVLIDTALELRAHPEIMTLCVGEGIRKPAMLAAKQRLGLTGLCFSPFVPIEQVRDLQRACDVALVTMQLNGSDSSVPSKLITYLANGLPVICAANANSAVARVLQEDGAGWIVPPGDGIEIANAILRLKEDVPLREKMARNARACYERRFTLARAYGQFRTLLESCNSQPADVSQAPFSA